MQNEMCFPEHLARPAIRAGRLIQLLEHAQPTDDTAINAVFLPERDIVPRIRTIVDFLRGCFPVARLGELKLTVDPAGDQALASRCRLKTALTFYCSVSSFGRRTRPKAALCDVRSDWPVEHLTDILGKAQRRGPLCTRSITPSP